MYAGRRGRRPLPCPTTVPPGRERRPRRAASTERPPGTPTGTPRVRGPPKTSAPTMPHHRVTWSGATSPARRANGDTTGRQREHPVYAGRRGRRPLPCPTTVPPGRERRPRRAASTERPPGTPTGTPRVRGPPKTSAPTMPHHRVTWSGATSPARRANGDTTGRQREHPVYAGRRGRRPLPCPTTVPPGRERRPRRAASTERPPGTPTGTPRVRGPPRTSAPTTRPCRPRLTPPCASARCRARRRPAPHRRPRPWAARSRPAHTDSGCLR